MCFAEFEDWHSDLQWMQQTFVWPPDLQAQCGAHTNLSQYCILLQPHHIISYCQHFMTQSDQAISQLDIARQQRLTTAVSRISIQQRMQIVYLAYRARFGEIGVCTLGGSIMPSTEAACDGGALLYSSTHMNCWHTLTNRHIACGGPCFR